MALGLSCGRTQNPGDPSCSSCRNGELVPRRGQRSALLKETPLPLPCSVYTTGTLGGGRCAEALATDPQEILTHRGLWGREGGCGSPGERTVQLRDPQGPSIDFSRSERGRTWTWGQA